MRACVTGGAGFIGSHLAERLVAEGHEVVVLDDLSTGRREHLDGVEGRVRFREGDVRSPADVDDAVAGCDVIFHQAALAAVGRSLRDPRLVVEVNVGGTLNVLAAARRRGVRRVVYASSSSVYGETPTLPKTETMPLAPASPYAATKAAGELLLGAFGASHGLETVALRYFNVYGPRQRAGRDGAVVPRFLEAVLAGRPVVIEGDGRQTRDLVHVDDVVEAACRAASAPEVVGRALNVGSGRRVAIRDLAEILAGLASRPVAREHAEGRPGDVRHSLADVARARRLLGWSPRVRLEDGLARLVAPAGGPQGATSPGSTSGP